jgi:hypothetical protein
MKKRAPGTGSVQLDHGKLRCRLPRSLDARRRWLPRSFALDEEKAAHLYLDACIREFRKNHDAQLEGLTLARVWDRYVAHVSRNSTRKCGASSSARTRATLEGMGSNWFSTAPFWERDLSLVRGPEVEAWLSHIQLTGKNARGEPVSDSWISQCAGAIRGVFRLCGMKPPDFQINVSHGKVDSALSVERQKALFQRIIEDPVDRLMAGCQMGAGLRVGELLSLRLDRVFLGDDPHLVIATGGPHDAPTKSGQTRRVELFEPGLGFFQRAVARSTENPLRLLFCGPRGGYLKAWGESFVAWSEIAREHLTTHDLRHTYAFAMLSGLWGYPPQDITFVSRQLGHADIRTTQRAYGHWDPNAGLATARRLRGEDSEDAEPVTAAALLGEVVENKSSPVSSPPRREEPRFLPNWVSDGNLTKTRKLSGYLNEVDRSSVHEAGQSLVTAVLAGEPGMQEAGAFVAMLSPDAPGVHEVRMLLIDGDARGVRRAIELVKRVLAEPTIQPATRLVK